MKILDGPGRVPDDADPKYRAAVDRLYSLSRSGTKLGLSRIAQVLVDLGHPELGRPCVHVAGSNGKGSTCAFLASILSVQRSKVGLFTSPHLVSLTERVQLVQKTVPTEVSRQDLVWALQEVEAVAPAFGELSFFEVITAAGLLLLKHHQSEIDIIEAGLGARLDATRLVQADVSVLTDLSIEHADFLGDTIEQIAMEEASVMRPRKPLVLANGPPAAMVVVEDMARALDVECHRIGREISVTRRPNGTFDFDVGTRRIEEVRLSLRGPHQGRNALLATKSALLIDPALSDEAIRRGLGRASWPGRMEVVPDVLGARLLLDGAHNPQGASTLAQAIEADRAEFNGPLHFVFGVMADKEVAPMLACLAPLATTLTLTLPPSPRARRPDELVQFLPRTGPPEVLVIEDVEEAWRRATALAAVDGGWVVVCGSLYLVGAVKSFLAARHASTLPAFLAQ